MGKIVQNCTKVLQEVTCWGATGLTSLAAAISANSASINANMHEQTTMIGDNYDC